MKFKVKMNNFEHVLESGFEKYEFLPMNIRTSKSFNFKSDGFGPMQFSPDDSQLNLVIEIFSDIFKRIHKEYSETHIFASPELIFKPTHKDVFGKIQLKINMLEKEFYEEILEKKKGKLDKDE